MDGWMFIGDQPVHTGDQEKRTKGKKRVKGRKKETDRGRDDIAR
jgi:hypothetical protein